MTGQIVTYISKLDAAKRQLEITIRLFMGNADIVAIHTLTGATHNILRNLSNKQGKESYIKDILLKQIKPEYQKKYVERINQAENFFKHADRDHDKLLEFTPEQTEVMLWDCCSMYQNITNEWTPLILIYRTWFFTKNPELLAEDKARTTMTAAISKLKLDYNKRQQFLELLPLISKLPL